MDLLKNLDDMITAKLILTGKETYDSEYPTVSKYDALEAMIEFAKLHVKEIQKLQKSKYYAGESGYIKEEELIEILNDIK